MSGSASASPVLCFDIFQLNLRAGEIRKHGVKLRLQGQPLQVLAVLLRRAGDMVTREELRHEIWPADTFVDFDHSLHNAIARIREALGDSAHNPRYIETLPRRGYRFIGEVSELAPEPPNSPVRLDLEANASQTGGSAEEVVHLQTIRSYKRIGLTPVVLLFALSLAIAFFASRPPTVRPQRLRSIAVLPLENLSGDSSQDCFVTGMTEQLITDLAKTTSLRVISRTSVMRYKGTTKGLPEIARELKVDAIIEGSMMRAGKRVRITVQLLHAPTDQHLWAETYERDLGDELSLQREIAEAIAQQVQARAEPQNAAASAADTRNSGSQDGLSLTFFQNTFGDKMFPQHEDDHEWH